VAASHPAPPLPLWWSAPGCALQLFGVFLLPVVVAFPFALLFETSEVVATTPALLGLSTVVLAPVSALHVLGLSLKARRELGYWRGARALGPARLVDVLYRHARVATARGWVLLFGGVGMTVAALYGQWASLGLVAVLALLLFYLLVGWTLFVSTFLARTFEAGLGGNDRGLTRQLLPAVTTAGEGVEEVFRLTRVPVPWGYRLVIEDPNPPRLRTESRYAVGVAAASGEVECRGRLRATPRGVYRLGPAQVSYQDLLGVTQVSVASVATAALTVLPRVLPVVIVDPPRSPTSAPDVITRPHRFATEDHFRFREYLPGDDTRRIHWRLSMRAGQLQVRLPESKELDTRHVLLLLDGWLPAGTLMDAAAGGEEILDALVLAWLGIARELVARGQRVTLIAAAGAPRDPDRVEIEALSAKPGTVTRWQDLGARVRWQSRHDVGDLLEGAGDDAHGVVVTARFTAPPPGPFPGRSTTWLCLDPADALGPPDPHWLAQVIGGTGARALVRWLLLLPHPVGSDDNHLWNRLAAARRLQRQWWSRRVLRGVAARRAGATFGELARRGDAVYRIERGPTAIRLVGVSAQRSTPAPRTR
jgi:uncharacterized protein (DUF58 family)